MAPAKTQPALLGGLAIGVLSALPVINIANCCCAWILFGGALAAYLMQQNHQEPIELSDGAVVGLFAGVVGSFVWLVVSVPMSIVMAPFQAQIVQRAISSASDLAPEARAFLEGLSNGPVVGLGLIFGFFLMLCVSTVFGMAGGLLGALMFRKNRPTPPAAQPAFPDFPGSNQPPPLPGDDRF